MGYKSQINQLALKLRTRANLRLKKLANYILVKKDSSILRPVKELKGFTKVELDINEEKLISMPFDAYSFRFFNVKTNKFEVEAGQYDIYIGTSSQDIRLLEVLTEWVSN